MPAPLPRRLRSGYRLRAKPSLHVVVRAVRQRQDERAFDRRRPAPATGRTGAAQPAHALGYGPRHWPAPENRHVGVVFQEALLFPHLSVERNLRYGERHRRRPRRTVAFSRVVEVLELGPLLPRYPPNLSGGERQRVALGRALLSGPELLMMDEPLASLDDPLKGRILSYLERAVAEWDITTLFVTHGQAEVRRVAEWVVVLENGRVLCAGPPDQALTQPGPLAWTNSAAPANLLRVEQLTAAEGHVTARVGGQIIRLPVTKLAPKSPSFIQFRPADVMLSRRMLPA